MLDFLRVEVALGADGNQGVPLARQSLRDGLATPIGVFRNRTMGEAEPGALPFRGGHALQGFLQFDGGKQLGEPGAAALLHGFGKCPDPPVPLLDAAFTAGRPDGLDAGHAIPRLLEEPFEPVRVFGGRHPQRQCRSGLRKQASTPTCSSASRLPTDDFRRKDGTAAIRQFDRIPRPRPRDLPQMTGFLWPELMGTRRDIGGVEPAHGTRKSGEGPLDPPPLRHSQPVVNSPPRWTPVPPPGRPRSRPTRIARS